MPTWEDYMKCKELDRYCEEYGIIVWKYIGSRMAIKVDSNRHPAFTQDNFLKIVESVEEAIAWIDGFVSVQWSSKLNIPASRPADDK